MQNVVNKDITPWIRPWNTKKFDDLYNRDERFFAILIKGFLAYMNRTVMLYDKPIQHFIFNTGSSYMYVETDGYEYTLSETSTDDKIYMKLPRCVVNMGNISIPTEELSSRFSLGTYERREGNDIKGFSAEIQRMPIEMSVSLHYVLSNMNESLILCEELVDKLLYQKYFTITYLGNIIQCSIEFPSQVGIQINKIDMSSADVNVKTIDIDLTICSSYPRINERTEIRNDKVIKTFFKDRIEIPESYLASQVLQEDNFAPVSEGVYWDQEKNIFKFTDEYEDDKYYDANTSTYISPMLPNIQDLQLEKYDSNRVSYIMHSPSTDVYVYWYPYDNSYTYVDSKHEEFTEVDASGVMTSYRSLSYVTDIRLYQNTDIADPLGYCDIETKHIEF